MDIPGPQPTPAAAPTASQSLNWARLLGALALALAVGFLGGVLFSEATDSPHDTDEFEIFWQSWDVLEREYYYGAPEDEALIRGAIQGLLSTTGDRYTFLAAPQRAELDRQVTAGEFGGIGAYVAQNSSGQIVITTPFNGFPAEEAGLLSGDVIESIDGTLLAGWSLEDAVRLMRGEIGSPVRLAIFRPSDQSRFEVTITRARVELPTVYAAQFGEVGYVRLFSFNGRATSLLQQETQSLLDAGAQALILDLRGNPGGLLDQAVGVSDLFLTDGLILTQRNRQGKAIEYHSTDGQIAEMIPLVVLIDSGSASASEVVAGALRDRARATLIGQTSYGKGSVQHVYDLRDGSQLHITAALWFTPAELPIQGQGLTPDVVVTDTGESEPDRDPYLEAALEYFAAAGFETTAESQQME